MSTCMKNTIPINHIKNLLAVTNPLSMITPGIGKEQTDKAAIPTHLSISRYSGLYSSAGLMFILYLLMLTFTVYAKKLFDFNLIETSSISTSS